MVASAKLEKEIDQAEKSLNRFVELALSEVTPQSIEEKGPRLLVECYVYGAIRYLTSYDDMPTSSTDILVERVFKTHFGATQEETAGCSQVFKNASEGSVEQFFMLEGASGVRRWFVGNEQVAGHLPKLLREHGHRAS